VRAAVWRATSCATQAYFDARLAATDRRTVRSGLVDAGEGLLDDLPAGVHRRGRRRRLGVPPPLGHGRRAGDTAVGVAIAAG